MCQLGDVLRLRQSAQQLDFQRCAFVQALRFQGQGQQLVVGQVAETRRIGATTHRARVQPSGGNFRFLDVSGAASRWAPNLKNNQEFK